MAASTLLLSAGLACGIGCAVGGGGPPLRIDAPLDGALLATHAVHVTGIAPDVSSVLVAGVETAVVDGRFEADVEVEEGEHWIVASSATASAHVSVRIDTTAPRLLVESPAEGALVAGRTLEVRGHVNDESPVLVTVDDEPVAVDQGNAFRLVREVTPGAWRLRVHARDAAGNESYAHAAAIVGDFLEPGGLVHDAAAVGLGREALDELAHAAETLIAEYDIAARVREANPIASGSWGEISVTDIRWDRARVALEPHAGVVRARIELTNLVVLFRFGEAGATTGLDGHMSATTARFGVGVSLGAASGRVVAGYDSASAVLEGFSYDLVGVPGAVEGLFRDTAREMVETRLAEAIAEKLPPMLEQATNALPLTGDVSLGSAQLEVVGAVRTVAVDDAGLWIVADLGMRAEHPVEGRQDVRPVVLGGTLGSRVARPGVNAAGSLDVMNAALFAAWAAGTLELRRDDLAFAGVSLTTGSLALVLPSVRGLTAPETPVSVVLETPLPPVVSQGPGGLVVSAPDLHVALIAHDAGREILLARLAVGIDARARLVLHDGGAIGVELDDVQVTADVVDGPAGLPDGARLDALLDDLVSDFAPRLLGAAVVHLPSFSGFALEPSYLDVIDGYVRFEGALRAAPPAP